MNIPNSYFVSGALLQRLQETGNYDEYREMIEQRLENDL